MIKRVIIVLLLIMLILGTSDIKTTYCLREEVNIVNSISENIEIFSDNVLKNYLICYYTFQTAILNNIYKNSAMILAESQKVGSESICTLIYDKFKITIDNEILKPDIIYYIKLNNSDKIKVVLGMSKKLGNEYRKLRAFDIWRFTAGYNTPPNNLDTVNNSNVMKALLPTTVTVVVAVILIIISAVHKKLNK